VADLWWLLAPIWWLLPVAFVAAAVVFAVLVILRVRSGKPWSAAILGAALDVGVGAAIVSVLALTLTQSGDQGRRLVLVPFAEWRESVGSPDAVSQHVGNVLMFIPLGLLVPLRWRSFDSVGRVVLASAAFSVGIELMQWVVPTGREASITDVITNTAGGMIGYGLLCVLRPIVRRRGKAPLAHSR
jgi:glycopeptide antibiotics resistance protein